MTVPLKTSSAMNAKISVFVICVEAYLLLYNFHDCTLNNKPYIHKVKLVWGFQPNGLIELNTGATITINIS